MTHLKGRITYKRWNAQETQFLKDAYGVLTVREIAEELKRTRKSVRFKAQGLGLHRGFEEISFDMEVPWWISCYVVDYIRKNGV